ncbi:MAG: hypothetical protein HY069_04880, partial [Chlamydiia bacterium]|nr:hypothetical protein [Chlamydiia bacterium]
MIVDIAVSVIAIAMVIWLAIVSNFYLKLGRTLRHFHDAFFQPRKLQSRAETVSDIV